MKIINSYGLIVEKYGYGVNNLVTICLSVKFKTFVFSNSYKYLIQKMMEIVELFSTNSIIQIEIAREALRLDLPLTGFIEKINP